MSLQNHIDIFFNDLEINGNINFKEIWFDTFDKVYFNKKKKIK